MNVHRVATLLRQLADELEREALTSSPDEPVEKEESSINQCAFCGRPEGECEGGIARGPDAAICGECIRLASDVLAERKLSGGRYTQPGAFEIRHVVGFSSVALTAVREKLRLTLTVDANRVTAAVGEVLAPPSDGHSFVYFIRDHSGRIKIGTARHVQSRLSGLQTGSAAQLELLLAIPGGHRLESALHQTFAHARVSGEWFDPVTELTDLILFLVSLRDGATHG